MYKPQQLMVAGRNGVHVEHGIVLILVSCPVFINWFSPFSHVGKGYSISNYIQQKTSIKILGKALQAEVIELNENFIKEPCAQRSLY